MNYFFVFTMMFFSLTGNAGENQLPEATVNQEVLGGDILLIKMKDHVVISGKESKNLEQELGHEAKKQFILDLVMTKTTEELVASYNPLNDKKTVQIIINRYSDVLMKIDHKPMLN